MRASRHSADRGRVSGAGDPWPRGVALALLCLLPLAGCAAPAPQDRSPAQVCRRVGTDDTLRPIPAAVVPQVDALFHTRMPAQMAVRSSVFRCDGGQALVCTRGANLPCGKANTSRHNTGAAHWCREHPDAAFIPAFAVGHDSIFAWRCRGSAPAITRQVFTVDNRGFIGEFWRRLPERSRARPVGRIAGGAYPPAR